jgi:hypothetical protein
VGVEKVFVFSGVLGLMRAWERGGATFPLLSSGGEGWFYWPAEESYQTFDVLGSGRQEELLSDELQPAQAQATKTDVTL